MRSWRVQTRDYWNEPIVVMTLPFMKSRLCSPCFVAFANYAVSADRLDGLSLAHLAHGELADPKALIGTSLTTIQYIYDSKNKNLLCKDVMDDHYTLTSIWANNPHYSSLAW